MVDISKCPGNNCPIKETCWRYTAPSNDEWQCWFIGVPYKIGQESLCDHYWPVVEDGTASRDL